MLAEKRKKPTINDVADMAGVSKRTVSRVINGSPRVSPDTRARIEQAIERLKFAPNRQARGLAARRSYLLGVVYDVPTLFINHIQKGMLSVCEDAGYDVVVHACHVESEGLVDDVLRWRMKKLLPMPPPSGTETPLPAADHAH